MSKVAFGIGMARKRAAMWTSNEQHDPRNCCGGVDDDGGQSELASTNNLAFVLHQHSPGCWW